MSQKWNLQDIRPAGEAKRTKPTAKKSVRPTKKRMVEQDDAADATIEIAPRPNRSKEPSITIENGGRKNRKRMVLGALLFFVIVGGAALLSNMLGKTELTIYPEFREPTISADFTAYPEKRDGELSYEVLTLEATDERQVKASGQVQVEEQATGMITIKKTTPGTQRLIKNTRFESSEGLVFRIQESAVVPGAGKNNAGELVPGSIQAKVFADEAGEDYNAPAGSSFTIPGFAEAGDEALFESVTASNDTAFSNGFSGPQFKIDETELNTARQELQIALRDQLLAKIENTQPADFIALPGAVAITYNQLPAVEFGDDLVTIREQAVLQIPLFKATEFGSFLAKEAVATYEGGSVRVDDPSVLSFTYTDPATNSSVIANAESLTFSLTGKPLLIWEYDQAKLTKNLAGLPKTALNSAITEHPGIKGARAHITPFWKRSFPAEAEEIVVIEELKLPQ